METKQQKRYGRHKRIRARIKGTSKLPRLCVFRSNKHVYGQLIDDEKGKTLIAVSDSEIKRKKTQKRTQKNAKIEIAKEVGKLLAKKAIDLSAGKAGKKIEKIVFDRGGYKYHGRIKALAEGAREGGLKF